MEQIFWNEYVQNRPGSNLYQLSEWKGIIETSYQHQTHYLCVRDRAWGRPERGRACAPARPPPQVHRESERSRITGVLPLVHIKHWLFGNHLVSIPYFDAGGVLADASATEHALIERAIELAGQLGATGVEMRQTQPLRCIEEELARSGQGRSDAAAYRDTGWYVSATTPRARLTLALPESPDALMRSFKSKLRSQIRKPTKEGLSVVTGRMELVDDFYHVFSHNMRDLGSPVHDKRLITEVLRGFVETAWIFVVYGNGIPLACSLCIGYKDVLANPWASSLRRYSHLAPNMLLYWAMLELGCQKGYRYFDFGRSRPGEGTYKFKQQWGAIAQPLHWYRLAANPADALAARSEKEKMRRAIEYWKKLPVAVTKALGPRIRKYISL
jgi:FemAB-related protein (PEP-CTERM system-associated)